VNAETFLEQLAHLTEATNGIPKLRELILQLAVRGKLVPQNPNDEPASELIKRIKAEKQRLIAKGIIRKTKALHDEQTKGTRYPVPSRWTWARVDDAIISVVNGFSGKQQKEPTGYPVTRIETVSNGSVDRTRVRYVANMPLEARKKHLLEAGDVLLSHINSGVHVGKTAIYLGGDPLFHGVNLLRIRLPYPSQMAGYFHIYMNALRFAGEFQKIAQHAIGQQSVNQAKLRGTLIPLPPLEEQKRIVAKVDELMALCDELEAKQQAVRTKQIALNRASLNALADPNGGSLTAAWHRVRDHFDHLYTVPETVAELRQTIRQLAVMGRLVPQDPNEEPASELLKKIQAEKHRLIAEGAIREPKPLPPIEADEMPYEAPDSWIWARFGDATYNRDGERIPVSREERKGRQGSYPYYGASGVIDSIDGYLFDKPLLLIGEDGANLVNRSTPIAFIAAGKYWVNNHAHVLDGFNLDVLKYIELFINATDLLPYITGTAQPKMNQAKMNSIPVALPPAAEQKRIVAKVDQLMTLCDDLEAKLQQSQTDADNLLTAIVHELVETETGVATG
jgi:type I restriction enzyme, S subunit